VERWLVSCLNLASSLRLTSLQVAFSPLCGEVACLLPQPGQLLQTDQLTGSSPPSPCVERLPASCLNLASSFRLTSLQEAPLTHQLYPCGQPSVCLEGSSLVCTVGFHQFENVLFPASVLFSFLHVSFTIVLFFFSPSFSLHSAWIIYMLPAFEISFEWRELIFSPHTLWLSGNWFHRPIQT
jgi:hypothetical protein